ncbi:MAG: glycosyltransferase [Prevotellaceae bacterium]|jgi:glycosyltransferase involved in cell wall biosynthesis|nr:glycosyltransferase [Prevotellaceae bacterium]
MDTFELHWNTCEQLLLAVAVGLFLIQLLYYLLLYNRIGRHNRAARRGKVTFADEAVPLSVIIYARDEADNLRNNLPAILEQDHPQFEVIVINDGNNDESEAFLTLQEAVHPNLYHSFVPESSRYVSRRKLGITLGIKASRYDWVVVTDADCRPVSNGWLRLMARNFTPNTEMVLGYSDYEHHRGWLHKRIAFDNLFTSMRYLGCALSGRPYMGKGRNMAYRKELFFKHKGFSSHLSLTRGDDDLFVNDTARRDNTRVETDAQAATRVMPLPRAKDWREEKIGYMSTSRFYRGSSHHLLGLETLTRLLFYVALATIVVQSILGGDLDGGDYILIGAAALLFLLRWAVQAAVVNTAAATLGMKRRFYITLPLFDWLQPLQSLRWKLYCLFRKKREFMRK